MIDVSFWAETPKVLPDIQFLQPQISHDTNPCVGVRFWHLFAHVFCFLIRTVHYSSKKPPSSSVRSAQMTGQIFGCRGIFLLGKSETNEGYV